MTVETFGPWILPCYACGADVNEPCRPTCIGADLEDEGCEGHPAGPYDPMGLTVYCDGSCAR